MVEVAPGRFLPLLVIWRLVPKSRTARTDGAATAQGIRDNKMLPQYLTPDMALRGGRALDWRKQLPDLTPLQK